MAAAALGAAVALGEVVVAHEAAVLGVATAAHSAADAAPGATPAMVEFRSVLRVAATPAAGLAERATVGPVGRMAAGLVA